MADAREDITPFTRAQLHSVASFGYDMQDAWDLGGGLIEVEFRHTGQIMQAGFAYLRADGHQVASIETILKGRPDKMPWAKPGERATLFKVRVFGDDKIRKDIEVEKDFDDLTTLTPPGIDPRDYPRRGRGWARMMARCRVGRAQPVEIGDIIERMYESKVEA